MHSVCVLLQRAADRFLGAVDKVSTLHPISVKISLSDSDIPRASIHQCFFRGKSKNHLLGLPSHFSCLGSAVHCPLELLVMIQGYLVGFAACHEPPSSSTAGWGRQRNGVGLSGAPQTAQAGEHLPAPSCMA